MMRRRTFLSAGLGLAAAPAARARDGPAEFDVAGRLLLRAYQAFVETHLAGVLRSLRALARTSDAQSGQWSRVEPALRELSADSATYATIWYARPDGSYFSLATNGASGLSLADRPYFADLLAGRDVEGSLVVSRSTGHHSVIVATPVLGGAEVVAALGASIDARLLSELVANATDMPADLTFYALDARGQAAIHRDPGLTAVFPSDLGDPSLTVAVAHMLARRRGVVRYDFAGTHRTALFETSEATGWRFVLARLRR